MSALQPPRPLSFIGNVAENWRRWRQQFELYLLASEQDKKPSQLQCAILLHVAGEEAQTVYNTFDFQEDETNNIQVLLDKFQDYCVPRKNVTFERHMFNLRSQKEAEPFDSFLTDLKLMAKNCEFGLLTESLVKDRIVAGLSCDQTRARLLRESDLTLEKAAIICKTAESAVAQLKTFVRHEKSEDIHALQSGKHASGSSREKNGFSRNRGDISLPSGPPSSGSRRVCQRCGYQHPRMQCPAWGKICAKCKRSNHFARKCRSTGEIHEIEETPETGSEGCAERQDYEDFYIDQVKNKSGSEHRADWSVQLTLDNKQQFKVKLDTGAQCNVLSATVFDKLRTGHLEKSKARLTSYSKHSLHVKGKSTLVVDHKGKFFPVEFQVVHDCVPAVLGLPTCVALNLVQRVLGIHESPGPSGTTEDILKEFSDVFQGLGKVDFLHHIELDPDVLPVVHAPRKLPFSLLEPVKQELKRMEELQVIAKVTKPTKWVNSMLVVNKNNKIRICLDPKDLNKAIKREHYPARNLDEIAAKMVGATVYSVLDASSGFWQIPVDEESSDLLTFNTPFGRYKFLRLPFGISSAPEVFQRVYHEIFGPHPNRDVSMDDIILWGRDGREHDEALKETLQTARASNLRLRKEKSQIKVSKVTFVGHEFAENGIKPTDSHIQAVTNMPTPTNKIELQRFLGMVNYMNKFIPNMSTIAEPLRQLLRERVAWVWDSTQDCCFQALKDILVTKPVLAYYDITKPLHLSVDASNSGLGACILQEGRAIAYASRTLTQSERNYAQIEKELLAITFGAIKFHQYTYGRKTIVETDHKPLEHILKKSLVDIPPRLQRMALLLQKYDLDVHYEPGRNLKIADALSRAPVPDMEVAGVELPGVQEVHLLLDRPLSHDKLVQLQHETLQDKTLLILKQLVQEGWPDQKTSLDPAVRQFWNDRGELSMDNGLLLRGWRIVVPASMRKDLLLRIHGSHLGVEKCKARARDLFYWPGINAEVEDLVSRCETCIFYQRKQTKEPMIPSEIPTLPWQLLSTDLYHCNGTDYLILTDYYSKFYEISKLSDTRSPAIIEKLKENFARYGIPLTMVSDNGPQFSCREFREFAYTYGFHHVTSSPKYPKGNGKAERAVQDAKRLIKKCIHANSDIYLALLEARNTPHVNAGSPVQRLMGRRTRSTLPTTEQQLTPAIIPPKCVQSAIQVQQDKQKVYYDKTARLLPQLRVGEPVQLRTEYGTWMPAQVKQPANTPRSYIVHTGQGQTFRKNRIDLRQRSKAPLEDNSDNAVIPASGQEQADIEGDREVTKETPVNGQQEQSGGAQVAQHPEGGPIRETGLFQSRAKRNVKPHPNYRDFVLYSNYCSSKKGRCDI